MSKKAHIIDCDADPFPLDTGEWGEEKTCSVEEHRKGGSFTWDPTRVRPYLSEKQKNGSKYILGNELREELKFQPVLNTTVLKYLYKPENRHLIPEEWKDGREVYFWGTIYREDDDDLCVMFLCWYESSGWGYGHRILSQFFRANCPAAVLEVGVKPSLPAAKPSACTGDHSHCPCCGCCTGPCYCSCCCSPM